MTVPAPYTTRSFVANANWNVRQPLPGFSFNVKHNHYKDFGYPENLTFYDFYYMYERNGYAFAAVNKTAMKTWQDNPWLLEKERDGSQGKKSKETTLEKEVRKRFEALRLWQSLAEADRRGMVGEYAGVILRLADNLPFDMPVSTVSGGLDGLVEVIPAWQGQLTVGQWGTDQNQPDTYGQPIMYQFNEAAVGQKQQPRQFNVHPDRVLIWSRDGTVNCMSALKPGYNDLLDIEKVSGAGGEGFWKNAKSAPALMIDKDADIKKMATAMGVGVDEVRDLIDQQVGDYNKGFDNSLLLQGVEAKTLNVTLPSPEFFADIPKKKFAASFSIPMKILDGSQSGERASTEDGSEWDQTNNARRVNIVKPLIMALVQRLVKYRILAEKDWFIDWTDLTEASMDEKIARAGKMAEINSKMQASGEVVFTSDEIREVVDKEPLSDDEKYRDETTDDDEADALDAKPTPTKDKQNA